MFVLRCFLVVLFSTLFIIFPSRAETGKEYQTKIVTLFDYPMTVLVPSEWSDTAYTHADNEHNKIVIFFPKYENIQNWNQMIAVMVFKDDLLTPKDFFEKFRNEDKAKCKGEFKVKLGKITSKYVDGSYHCTYEYQNEVHGHFKGYEMKKEGDLNIITMLQKHFTLVQVD